jgi:3-deoxy-manno-octulosonate cytidylyltransferase (CMP-KDO synthetase)
MATLCEEISDESEIANPNVVKVIFNKYNAAIYFSRLPIPWHKEGLTKQYFRHIGIYAYRAGFLKEYTQMPRCELEQKESLEQLRALYHGETILVEEACAASGIGIDTEEDLQRARKLFK